ASGPACWTSPVGSWPRPFAFTRFRTTGGLEPSTSAVASRRWSSRTAPTTKRSALTSSTSGGPRLRTPGPQHLLGDPLDVRRVDLPLVGFHDVADQAAHLLGVGDLERIETLAHERAQSRLVHALGQVALAELDVEAQLRGVRRPALADLLELGQGLLELLAVGADHVEHERVVDRAGEALGGAARADLRLDHADDVGGARVLLLDRLRQRLVERLLECHGSSCFYCTRNLGSSTSRRPSPRRFRLSPETVRARPGKRLTQNASRITFLPLAITLPHEGTYGGTPTPRKPRIASARIA